MTSEEFIVMQYYDKGLSCTEIACTTGIDTEVVYQIVRAHKDDEKEKNKFPPRMLRDWDETTTNLLAKYGGAKYRDVVNQRRQNRTI